MAIPIMTIITEDLDISLIILLSKIVFSAFAWRPTIGYRASNGIGLRSEVPVAVGFGISKNSHIKELKNYADAAVIGSAIIDVISDSENNEIDNVVKFIKGLLK